MLAARTRSRVPGSEIIFWDVDRPERRKTSMNQEVVRYLTKKSAWSIRGWDESCEHRLRKKPEAE